METEYWFIIWLLAFGVSLTLEVRQAYKQKNEARVAWSLLETGARFAVYVVKNILLLGLIGYFIAVLAKVLRR